MLHVRSHERLDGLADGLATVLSDPMSDPMSPEWIVVGSAGIGRWLRLQLAQHLGSSGLPGATDGVAANLDLLYPGRLTRQVLASPDVWESDPWQVDRLAWAVLSALTELGDDTQLGPAARRAPGATAWSQARRIADNYDRYILHRPQMIRAWLAHRDLDGSGAPLAERARWQAYLFRVVHERLGTPSTAETLPDLLVALSRGVIADEVPERVCLFGLTTIPGGEPFLQMVDALSTQREVHLFLHQPSAVLAGRVHRASPGANDASRRQGDEVIEEAARHPLLRSWARPAVEAVMTLGARFGDGTAEQSLDPVDGQHTTLGQLQADIRANREPGRQMRPPVGDTSLRIHSCHGATRQVEVLRDQILHILATNPELSEDDVVVLCPALDEFAPLVEAAWGPSAGADHPTQSGTRTPTLSYKITDRSLTSMAPMLAALASLVELLDSRFSDAAVLDFVGLTPVRERFGFDDADMSRLADWVETANTRWGIDGEHRQRWGLPSEFTDGSWSATLDRLVLGIMVTDDPSVLALGGSVPIGVEGSDVLLAGRLGDLLARLRLFETSARHSQPIAGWLALLNDASTQFFASERGAEWQAEQLIQTLKEIGDNAQLGDETCDVDISLAELRALLGRHLDGSSGRTDFFRGGITITSLTPLRGVPFPVVCLLGVDESAFATSAPDGDDLVALSPALGDRDRRADVRQALLDAVLSAGSHLVLTRSGHSVVTNQPIPPAVVLTELSEAISATLDPAALGAAIGAIRVTHPRQSYDERNFTIGAVVPESPVPWGFDPLGRDGALRRRSPAPAAPFLAQPLDVESEPVIELTQLHDFLNSPVRYFVRTCLGIELPNDPTRTSGRLVAPSSGASSASRPDEGRNLVLELDYLEKWKLADRLLAHRRSGGDVESFRERELASNFLPPGRLAEQALADASEKIDPIIEHLGTIGVLGNEPTQIPVDVRLPDGTRIVGSVRDDGGSAPGPVTVTASEWHIRHQLASWLDLLVLTAHDPKQEWSASLVGTSSRKVRFRSDPLIVPGDASEDRQGRAFVALAMVIDLYQRGRREPLPLFSKTSSEMHSGNGGASRWRDYQDHGDCSDRWVRLAFGDLTFDQLIAIRCRSDDPPGPDPSRARRYAAVLWDAFDASLSPDDDAAGDPS